MEQVDLEKAAKLAVEKTDRILSRAFWNSLVLGFVFSVWSFQGFQSGSYWMLGFGSLAFLTTVWDCIDIYRLRKAMNEAVNG
jgi:hypothetical protein